MALTYVCSPLSAPTRAEIMVMPKEHARIWQCVSGSSAAAQLPRTLIYLICLTISKPGKNEHFALSFWRKPACPV